MPIQAAFFGAIKESASAVGKWLRSLRKIQRSNSWARCWRIEASPGCLTRGHWFGEGSREPANGKFQGSCSWPRQEAANLVSQKASPEEAKAYKQMVMDVAEKAANAAKRRRFSWLRRCFGEYCRRVLPERGKGSVAACLNFQYG